MCVRCNFHSRYVTDKILFFCMWLDADLSPTLNHAICFFVRDKMTRPKLPLGHTFHSAKLWIALPVMFIRQKLDNIMGSVFFIKFKIYLFFGLTPWSQEFLFFGIDIVERRSSYNYLSAVLPIARDWVLRGMQVGFARLIKSFICTSLSRYYIK